MGYLIWETMYILYITNINIGIDLKCWLISYNNVNMFRISNTIKLKKVNKWVSLCCTLDSEWVTVMDVLNLNSMKYIVYEKRFWAVCQTISHYIIYFIFNIAITIIYLTLNMTLFRYNFFPKILHLLLVFN